MSINIIQDNLLNSTAKYIVHQANCVSIGASGLARAIFDKFPYADIYSNRLDTDLPGEIAIRGNGDDERYVIAIFGQYYPGLPRESGLDISELRQQWFKRGLEKVAEIPDLNSVAFPFNIGCGLAGGDWNVYLKMIQEFAKTVADKADVYIIKL